MSSTFARRNRRRLSYIDRTGMRGATTKFKTGFLEENVMIPLSKEIVMGADNYRDMYISKFIDERLQRNVSTVTQKMTVRGNVKSATDFIRTKYAANEMFSAGTHRIVVNVGADILIEVESNHNTIDFTMHGTFESIDKLKTEISDTFEEILICVKWVYDDHGSTVSIPLDATLAPIEEMYPWLKGESLDSYYKRYEESNASIIILIGPPGTGKTSFIRGYLLSTQSSAIVTYDDKILKGDSIFSEFIEGDANALIIEDADLFLSSRKDGNDMMHRFLNVGDGLVTVKGKKMIFSTNLPSIKDIDPALLRAGRTFDIVTFGSLDVAESTKLANKFGISFMPVEGSDKYSIAEVFNATSEKKQYKSEFGFI